MAKHGRPAARALRRRARRAVGGGNLRRHHDDGGGDRGQRARTAVLLRRREVRRHVLAYERRRRHHRAQDHAARGCGQRAGGRRAHHRAHARFPVAGARGRGHAAQCAAGDRCGWRAGADAAGDGPGRAHGRGAALLGRVVLSRGAGLGGCRQRGAVRGGRVRQRGLLQLGRAARHGPAGLAPTPAADGRGDVVGRGARQRRARGTGGFVDPDRAFDAHQQRRALHHAAGGGHPAGRGQAHRHGGAGRGRGLRQGAQPPVRVAAVAERGRVHRAARRGSHAAGAGVRRGSGR